MVVVINMAELPDDLVRIEAAVMLRSEWIDIKPEPLIVEKDLAKMRDKSRSLICWRQAIPLYRSEV